MRLYKDKVLLDQAVSAAARHFKADPSIVERDYYASVFLKRLSGQLPDLLLCGGTSLSKCYRAINRFSDDIDLTLTQDQVTDNRRKQVKKAIKGVCTDLGFSLLNEDEIKTRRDFNRYEIDYSPKRSSASLRPVIRVDTFYPPKASSYESRPVSSMIYEYMSFAGQEDFIRLYKLQPFPISVQTMDRTLADKVFDLCDAYLSGRISGQSYHIYDISRLLGHVNPDAGFAEMFSHVRAERRESGFKRYISADDAYSIPEILSEITEKAVFKKDYDINAARLIFDGVSYEEAAASLQRLTLKADSGL